MCLCVLIKKIIGNLFLNYYRSSDSTKYGTNKSSGTSVTSGNHHKAIHMSGAHESVSNGKPPIHPHSQRNSIAPVHSSNNRLYNNTIFQNNQYTFSLSRNGDGYLESARPYSAASLYGGDGGRVSRGTKSDIGVPTSSRRQSTSRSFLTGRNDFKSKIPSVKSDFLLSYLSHSSGGGSNQSASNNTSAYHISDIINYNNNTSKTAGAIKYVHSNSSSSKMGGDYFKNINEKHQQQQQQNQQRNSSAVHSSNCVSQQTNANSVGPLLYLDNNSSSQTNNRMMSNTAIDMYQSMQRVSKFDHIFNA